MPEEYFTWKHEVNDYYLYSCEGCAYKNGKECTRRPEMQGIELPPPSDKPLCMVGKKA